MPQSSIEFAAELQCRKRLRQCVLAAAAATLSAGVLCLLSLPLALIWKLLASVVWVLYAALGMYRLSRAWSRYSRLRLDSAGTVLLYGAGHGAEMTRIMAGSVVLPAMAWLRLRGDDGRVRAELLTGNSRENKDWRRLQLIWRHL